MANTKIIKDQNMIEKQFGMLTVLNGPRHILSESGKTIKQWFCRCGFCGKEEWINDSKLKNEGSVFIKCCGCKRQRITPRELTDWDRLYQYVRCEIMGYDERKSLSREMVLALKGLSKGQPITNSNTSSYANYSYEVVLKTFISCKPKIDYAISNKQFNSELGKLIYFCRIVEKNLPVVFDAIENANRQKECIQAMNCPDVLPETGEQQSERFKKAREHQKRKPINKALLYEDFLSR